MAKISSRIALHIGSDERLQMLDGLIAAVDNRAAGRAASLDRLVAAVDNRAAGGAVVQLEAAADRRAIRDQVWLTTSGIFDQPPFICALQTFGIDRIMFSVDYPYAPNANGRAFLDRLSLAPADMAKLTHGNADALLKLNVMPG